MTAVEVLVATLLASLMLGSVVGLLGALTRQERVLRKRTSMPPAWHVQLVDQLKWDLANSREFFAAPDSVTLVGFAGRDFASVRPTGRPAEITYYLVDAIGDRWLVRRERHCDEPTNDSSRIELLCRGVNRFEFGTAAVDRPGTSTRAGSAIATPMPERIVIRMFKSTSAEPLFEKEFLTR